VREPPSGGFSPWPSLARSLTRPSSLGCSGGSPDACRPLRVPRGRPSPSSHNDSPTPRSWALTRAPGQPFPLASGRAGQREPRACGERESRRGTSRPRSAAARVVAGSEAVGGEVQERVLGGLEPFVQVGHDPTVAPGHARLRLVRDLHQAGARRGVGSHGVAPRVRAGAPSARPRAGAVRTADLVARAERPNDALRELLLLFHGKIFRREEAANVVDNDGCEETFSGISLECASESCKRIRILDLRTC
jgi:hypothetical protein